MLTDTQEQRVAAVRTDFLQPAVPLVGRPGHLKTPCGITPYSARTVRQEVWGALLSYNPVRLEMAEVVREVGVVPADLSFTTALHYLRYELAGWRSVVLEHCQRA